MGVSSGIYKALLVLHLLAAILGFGPVMLAGAFGAKAKARRGPQGQAIAEATYEVISQWADKFMYAVPVLGILLVLVSDDAWKFSQAWISFSFLLYFVALGVVHGAHLPNLRRMNRLMAELNTGVPPPGGAAGGAPPQVAELEERGKRAGIIGGFLNLLIVVIVVLMVWKPGV